jgi:hypothetical protein
LKFAVPINASLKSFLASFITHTSDMGVEFSIPYYLMGDVEQQMPPWLDGSKLRSDLRSSEMAPPLTTIRGLPTNSGVDIAGADRQPENGEDDPDGEESFSFARYVYFALTVNELPENVLASWGKACVCHGDFLAGLNVLQRRKVLEMHFGKGLRVCPMGGKQAPEAVAGKLFEVLEVALDDITIDILPHDVGYFAVDVNEEESAVSASEIR